MDRYDASVALQLWQRLFVLALAKGVVSASEEVWRAERISALEYLARGRLMALLSLFFDGPVSSEEGDIDLFQAAQQGVALVRDDVPALVDELESEERALRGRLADRLAYIAEQGADAVLAELDRVPEMIEKHRAWFNSPLAVARGRQVAREIERAEMPPTSSAPNEGFNPAFFPPAQPISGRFPNRTPLAAVPSSSAPSSSAPPAPEPPAGEGNKRFNPAFFPPPPEPELGASGDTSPNRGFNPRFFPPPKDSDE